MPLKAHKGMNFAVREGGITIGAGVVVELLADAQAPGSPFLKVATSTGTTDCPQRNEDLEVRCLV